MPLNKNDYKNVNGNYEGTNTLIDDIIDEANNIGDRQYTEQNVVTNGESITKSIDELDVDLASHKAESASKHITESGSNDDGKYIKFDDGTMICIYVNTVLSITEAIGNMFRSENKTWVFPKTFLSDYVVVSGTGSSNSWITVGATYNMSTSVNLYRATSRSNEEVFSVLAIGRWK